MFMIIFMIMIMISARVNPWDGGVYNIPPPPYAIASGKKLSEEAPHVVYGSSWRLPMLWYPIHASALAA
jgi:hypothetical protein